MERIKLMNQQGRGSQSLPGLDAGSLPSLFGNLTDGILMVDNDGIIRFANERFCRLIGCHQKELTGLSFFETAFVLFDEESISWLNAKLQKIFKGQQQFFRHRWKNRKGHILPVEIDISPISNSGQNIIGALFVIKDIHSRILLEITNTVNSTLELEEVLKNTNRIIIEMLGLNCNAIFLLSENSCELQMTSCFIQNKQVDEKYTVPVTQGNLGRIAVSGNAAYLGNLEDELAGTGFRLDKTDSVSIVGYPLLCKGETLGVITFGVDKVRKFSEVELDLFHSISNQVAMAIYNAKLYRTLEYLSVTDGLTGLYNHKYFKKSLKEEIRKARGNYGLSLLMIDVDSFKQYNDNFGHPAGDQLLEKLARILKNNMRSRDIVARYGGEEFAIILVDIEPMAALHTAEKIRQAVERYRFYGREMQPGGRVTISIGLGNFPSHAGSAKELIEVTDRAMYEAKMQKNTVVLAR